MSRLLVALIAFSVLGYLAYRTLYGRAASPSNPEAPTEQLQHVREKAKDIEVKQEQRLDEAERKLQE